MCSHAAVGSGGLAHPQARFALPQDRLLCARLAGARVLTRLPRGGRSQAGPALAWSCKVHLACGIVGGSWPVIPQLCSGPLRRRGRPPSGGAGHCADGKLQRRVLCHAQYRASCPLADGGGELSDGVSRIRDFAKGRQHRLAGEDAG
jgi:hypothetical protein